MQDDSTPAIIVRLKRAEKDIENLQSRLNSYVTATVADLRISAILEATNRISAELQDVKSSYKTSYDALSARLAEQQANTSKIQINVLKATVGTFVTVVASLFVGYLTHFFH